MLLQFTKSLRLTARQHSCCAASSWTKVPIAGETIQHDKRFAPIQIHGEWSKAYGTGRRKKAIARVWLRPGDGNISINKKDLVSYFDRAGHRTNVVEPFVVTKSSGKWDVKALVSGGGKTGQAQAIRHGIALAMRNAYPLRYTQPLRRVGLTTRDPRMVERKKPGQPKARKKFQWVKR